MTPSEDWDLKPGDVIERYGEQWRVRSYVFGPDRYYLALVGSGLGEMLLLGREVLHAEARS